jgi:hypothetical protein
MSENMTRWSTIILLSLASISFAQPVPKIISVVPEWFQRGVETELTISGENLQDATALIFSGDPGLSAAIVPRETPTVTLESSRGGISSGDSADANTIFAKVTVTPEGALTVRELRVATPSGISNPFGINVSHLREAVEKKPNNSTNDAQHIELPVGISGVIYEPSETDYFKFSAKQGQELIFEVLAFRSGSPLDPSLALLDASGKELVRSEDAKGFDSFIHFLVPVDGEYLLQLRDFRYEGSTNHKYHITAGALPFVDHVFPLGARRGQPVEVELQGYNLGETSKVKLRPESSAPLGWQEIRVHTANGLSTPFPFNVSDLNEVPETEPNNAQAQANSITPPVIVNGRIKGEKETDTFKFKFDRERTLVCEVTASRFGSPLDAQLSLRDAEGKVLQENDDADGADPRFEFKFEKDKEYTLSLRDLLGRSGDNFAYRLSIRAPQADFGARFFPDVVRVHRGGRALVRCEGVRRTGFGGAIQVACENLPPGVTAEPALLVPENPAVGLLLVSASHDASLGHQPLKLRATGALAGTAASRAAEPLSNDRPVKEAFLSVLDTPPFTLKLITLSASVEQDQTVNVEVQVDRHNGYLGEIKLTPEGFSAGREALTKNVDVEPVTLKTADSRAVLKLKAKLDAETATRPIIVKGEATVDGQTYVEYSELLPLTITQLPFTIASTLKRLSVSALPAGLQSAAAEAEFTIKLSRRGWFTDEVTLTLEGLPDGVTANTTNLPPRVSEAVFKLVATDKAPVGKEITLKVLAKANIAGREYQQRTEPIALTITAPQESAEVKP